MTLSEDCGLVDAQPLRADQYGGCPAGRAGRVLLQEPADRRVPGLGEHLELLDADRQPRYGVVRGTQRTHQLVECEPDTVDRDQRELRSMSSPETLEHLRTGLT